MNKGSLKRFAYSAAAGLTTLFGLSALSACNLEMVKEVGYTSSRYAVTAQFTQIEIDAEGGLEFSLSYGDQFSVTYTESEQDKLVFSTKNDTLFVTQHSDVALIGYKKKELSIVVPTDNKISSVKASSGGALECSLAGEYGALSFESDGILSVNLAVTAESVSLDSDGKMTAELSGSAERLIVNCDGLVSLGSRAFSTAEAKFDCDGGANFELTCTSFLSVKCNGVCNGIYYGDPTVEKTISGAGTLKKGE